MKKILRLFVIFAIIGILMYVPVAIAAPNAGDDAKKAQQKFQALDANEAVAAMTPGWNLGNTLDAVPTEGSWNNPPVEEHTFDDIKNSGFKSVRIPVTWDSHIGPGPEYRIDDSWMRRVEQVTDWALERDFYVVLNVHHDSWLWVHEMERDPEGTLDKLEKVWAQIARHFGTKSEKLMFEVINEPTGMNAEQMNHLNRSILETIRTSGGYNDERLVIVGALHDNGDNLVDDSFEVPDDEHLILTFHYYSPWDYVAGWWGNTTWGTAQDRQQMENDLRPLYERYTSQGYPIILGEYGTLGNNEKHSKWLYHDHLIRLCRQYGIATMWWDNGNDHFDRSKRQWRDPVVKDIIEEASAGNINAFIKPVDLYVRADEAVTDQPVDLLLNGNRLTGISHGSTRLVEGTDYTYDETNAKVTLKADFVAGLLEESKLGTNAQLTFSFSTGAEQVMDVIQYDDPTPTVQTIVIHPQDREENITIPLEWNGTKLRTIKAVTDATGRPVLEEKWDWTPYINYGDDFQVEDGQLELTPAFLEYVKENATLTVEFYPEGTETQVKLQVP
ncbi:cellulase family glycosylhydrolase [Desmospora activa]|uniref:Endoglucanase n=1 Tax=Desmospora activa DSM 45169 TaxID=1121389 RepID=A0A2T4ZC92_9BACL|nr:cellulase family glycosylhydrolase [Desmospora activa]PTM59508.1 endoglucanase [Desmospora activa DSM 45169]